MTEAFGLQQEVESQNLSAYDLLKFDHSLPQDVKERWIKVDGRSQRFTEQVDSIRRNGDLTQEAKQRLAQELVDSEGQKIVAERKELRERILKAAKSAENASIPTPAGESISTSDATKLVASQNEAARIVRTIERMGSRKGPFPPSATDTLQKEYEHGLEVGGVEGGAICRGALAAARELGLGTDWLPRQPRHLESLQRADHLLYASNAISTQPPGLPRSLQQRRLSKAPERNRAVGLLPRAQEPVFKAEDQRGTAGTPSKRAAQRSAASGRKQAWK